MKPLLAVLTFVLSVFLVIFWGAYMETQLQYQTFQQMFSINIQCRTATSSGYSGSTIKFVEEICGPIPTWETFAS